MGLHQILEIISVLFGILYLVLMVKENILCWLFGILASAITIYLYIHVTLYLEAGLNFYYVLAGFYGWIYWHRHKHRDNTPVIQWKSPYHIANITGCLVLSLILGYVMHTYTNSERPYIDAGMTVFSFTATYMEARKVLSGWYYWFFINAFAIVLQAERGLYFFALLSIFYTGMCIVGYKRWKKTFLNQSVVSNQL